MSDPTNSTAARPPLRVHVTWPSEGQALDWLREAAGPGLTFSFGREPGTDAGDVAVLVEGSPDAERLASFPALETLVIPWAGVGVKLREVLADRPSRDGTPPLAVYNLHHNASATAEFAFALLLSVAKSVGPRDAELRRGDWSQRAKMDLALGLEGRHGVIYGAGAIGRRLRGMCEAFGMSTSLVGRSKRDGIHGDDELEALLPRAQVLFVCVPLTPETSGRLGAAQLAALPKDAIVVNVARGPVIDEDALFAALKSGHLFGAGLDVWWNYPTSSEEEIVSPANRPFAELDNVVFSPHRGGHIREIEPLRMRHLGDLLARLARGEVPASRVNLDLGY